MPRPSRTHKVYLLVVRTDTLIVVTDLAFEVLACILRVTVIDLAFEALVCILRVTNSFDEIIDLIIAEGVTNLRNTMSAINPQLCL